MIHLDFTFEDQRLIATRGDVDWQLTIVDTFTGTQACLSMPDEHAAMLLNFMMLGDETLHNVSAHELLREKYFNALPQELWLIP